ncbi:type II toxin-antitoxin system HicB family antitoxin [Hymenobacter nivis]|uniref:type II toxin-antitoxin system HicB family antitoxin n=1 Tax=Hymenobacter nivis TaxID=1850093 RepID=UPI001FE75A40|nr:type II toxin-antitoxin system HicB family antitoxin [Hymenobacter nivis]
MELTIIIQHGEDGWITGQLEQIPAVITQGRTMEELKFMLLDALALYLEVQQEQTAKTYQGQDFSRETFGQLNAA